MTDTPTIVESLSAVMAEVQAVGKTGRNVKQGYAFRGIDAVVNAVGPALRAHSVVVVPCVLSVAYETYTTSGGTVMKSCVVKVRYTFHGPAGDKIEATVFGESSDSGDKSTPKAHSVAFRTALLQALCIPTDEPDPDESSHERTSGTVAPYPSEPARRGGPPECLLCGGAIHTPAVSVPGGYTHKSCPEDIPGAENPTELAPA